MNIDFSALDRLTANAGRQEKKTDSKDPAPKKIEQRGTQPATGKHYPRLEAEREEAKRTAAAYREYQDNIKRAGRLRADITKGIHEGEDLYTLLLWSMEAISRMTNDRLFFEQGKADLQAVYASLGYAAPIAHRTQEAQERLNRLCSAMDREEDPGARERIKRAIMAHRHRLDQLAEQAKSADK